MSQAAFVRAFDAAAIAAFHAGGLADAAAYLSPVAVQAIADHDPDDPDSPPLPEPVPCSVLVDRNVEDFGDDAAPVSVNRTRITFQRGDLSPGQGGHVSLLDDDGSTLETFELVQRARGDESLSSWWVQEVLGA